MLLIVDDDKAIRASLSFMLKHEGHEVATAQNALEAKQWLMLHTPSLILMDMNFTLATTGKEGLALLLDVKKMHPQVPVLLMTAWGSIELAVAGMQAGAWDFVTKPWDNRVLMQRIETALSLHASSLKAVSHTIPSFSEDFNLCGIIGQSEALQEVLDKVKRVAPTNASVLITGESGTGKELIAEALHANSHRKQQSFVKVNLGGISQSLFESEMFGHKKGAFTDALRDRKGRFALADEGTIFLDEIGELDLSCQVKLLRVLQDQTYEVLGDSTPRSANVRVVSATNVDLQQAVKEGAFREDLFYRINLITLRLPALRERRDDIPLLVRHFMSHFAAQNQMEQGQVEVQAMEQLCRYPYYGNIRELKNLVERLMLVRKETTITVEDVTACYGEPLSIEHSLFCSSKEDVTSIAGLTLEEVEQMRIQQEYERCEGNLSQMARELGITRQSLYRRLEKYGLR